MGISNLFRKKVRLPLWMFAPSVMSTAFPNSVKYSSLYIRNKREGRNYIEFTKEEAEKARLNFRNAARNEYNLQRTAYLNGKGIAAEKAGNTEEAVAIYEAVIALGYPATHAYTRLMVLYRRNRKPEEEVRVITKAISVFAAENEKRAEAALREYPELTETIRAAAVAEEKVLGPNGFYCFVPYDVKSYKLRLSKLQKGQN